MASIDDGISLLQDGDAEAAFDCFYQLALADPNSADAWFYCGVAHSRLQGLDETVMRYVQQAYKIDPTHESTLEQLVSIHMNEPFLDLTEADRYLKEAKSAGHESNNLNLLEGKLAMALQDYDRAKVAFESTLFSLYDFDAAQDVLLMYGRLQDLESLENWLKKLNEEHIGEEEQQAVKLVAAYAYLEAKAWDQALTFSDQVQERFADNPLMHHVRGHALYWLKRPQEAIPHFEFLFEQEGRKDGCSPQLLLGSCLMAEEPERALPHLEAYYHVHPTLDQAETLGNLHYRLGHNEQAIHYWMPVFEDNPTKELYDDLLVALMQTDHERQLAFHKKYSSQFVDKDAEALRQKVRSLKDEENWSALVAELMGVLTQPDPPFDLCKELAGAHYQLGEFRAALNDVKLLRQQNSDEEREIYLRFSEAILHQKLGDEEKAASLNAEGKAQAGDRYDYLKGLAWAGFHDNQHALEYFERHGKQAPEDLNNAICWLNSAQKVKDIRPIPDLVELLVTKDIYTPHGGVGIAYTSMPAADFRMLADRWMSTSEWVEARDIHYFKSLSYSDGAQNELALEEIDKAIAIDPEHIPYLELKGKLLSNMGRSLEAETVLTKVTQASPDRIYAHTDLFQLAMQGKDFDQIIDRGEEMLTQSTGKLPAYAMERLLDCYFMQGSFTKGIHAAEQMKGRVSETPMIRILEAVFYASQREPEKRESLLQDLKAELPKHLDYIFHAWGLLHFYLKEYESALQHLKQWEEEFGKQNQEETDSDVSYPALGWNALAQACVQLNKIDEADTYYEKSVQQHPNQSYYKVLYAQFLYDHKDSERALKWAKEALDMSPEDEAVHRLYSRLIIRFPEVRIEYAERLDELLTKHPKHAQFLGNAASVHTYLEAPEKATDYYQKAEEAGFEFTAVHYFEWAKMWERQNKIDEAHEVYERFLGKKVTDRALIIDGFFTQWGDLHFEQGRFGDALTVLEQGMAEFPEADNLCRCAASCLLQLKRTEESRSYAEKALLINPENIEAELCLLAVDFTLENWAAVIERSNALLDRLPDDHGWLNARTGAALIAKGETESGQELLESVTTGIDAVRKHVHLAHALMSRNEAEAAIEALETTLESAPQHAEALFLLLHIYDQLGWNQKWYQTLERIQQFLSEVDHSTISCYDRDYVHQMAVQVATYIDQDPTLVKEKMLVRLEDRPVDAGRFLPLIEFEMYDRKNPHEARKLLFRLEEQVNENLGRFNNAKDHSDLSKGLLLLRQSESISRAQESAKKALEVNPAAREAKQYLGVAALLDEDYNEAATHFIDFLSSKSSSRVRFQLARTLTMAGKLDAANREFKNLLHESKQKNVAALIGQAERALCYSTDPTPTIIEKGIESLKLAIAALGEPITSRRFDHFSVPQLNMVLAKGYVKLALLRKTEEQKWLGMAQQTLYQIDVKKHPELKNDFWSALLEFKGQNRIWKPIVYGLLGASALALILTGMSDYINCESNCSFGLNSTNIPLFVGAMVLIILMVFLPKLSRITIARTTLPITFHKSYFDDVKLGLKDDFKALLSRNFYHLE